MQAAQLIAVMVPVGAALVISALVWRGIRRRHGNDPQERYRRDIRGLQRGLRHGTTDDHAVDIWSAGAGSDAGHSRGKKTGATLTAGLIAGGCGGCGGCGCGG
jgi:hypothetical protein